MTSAIDTALILYLATKLKILIVFENSSWKTRLIRFLIYVAVGFLCAFLYRYLKK